MQVSAAAYWGLNSFWHLIKGSCAYKGMGHINIKTMGFPCFLVVLMFLHTDDTSLDHSGHLHLAEARTAASGDVLSIGRTD